MASISTFQNVAPLASPLPDPPAGAYFTDDQWKMLISIMDTVIPDIRRESTANHSKDTEPIPDVKYNATANHIKETVINPPDSASLDEFLSEKPSDSPAFHELLRRTLVEYAREDARKGLAFVLSSLNTRVGALLLTGTSTPLYDLSIEDRTKILNNWRVSYLPPLQAAYKQLTFVAKNLWLKTSPTFCGVSGFPRVPDHYKPGPHFEYEFMQFDKSVGTVQVDTDVIVVGSGCGGGVCAKNLAEAGHQTLVIDKGYYFPPSQLPMSEKDAGIHLYVDGGVVTSDDGSTTVIAGSNWGGGGTINWSASLQPQSFVRNEWANDRKMPYFNTQEFQTSLDRVCARMGVSTEHIRHNHGNEVLLEGARKMGMTVKPVPQNTGGNEHFCGHCTLGCGAAQKQGPVVSWLPDAAKAGAKFIEGFTVDRVLFETVAGIKTAVGVKGSWKGRNSSGGVDGPDSGRVIRDVIVRSKRVIISCGSLWSPIVLLKSGLTNPHIGRNLYLHPVNIVSAVYPEDVRPWEGGILTSVVGTLENQDGRGHGTKLETTTMMPSWCLTFMNWTSGLQFKVQALKYRHMNSFIAITRDRDTGRVYPDPGTGYPRISYTPSAFDSAHTLEGVIALIRLNYVQGAREIHVSHSSVEPFVRQGADGDDERLESWISSLRKVGNRAPAAAFASAHQMGSCRMAASEKLGVVSGKNGEQGKVFGVDGLYVSDASVFPSASGVNPMVTNMGISDWISRGISNSLTLEANGILQAASL